MPILTVASPQSCLEMRYRATEPACLAPQCTGSRSPSRLFAPSPPRLHLDGDRSAKKGRRLRGTLGICMSCSKGEGTRFVLNSGQRRGGFDLSFPMKRDQANTVEDRSCSIQQSAQSLGLDSFTVHSLIQRRKLVADVTLCGELAISRREFHRVLSGAATSLNSNRQEI